MMRITIASDLAARVESLSLGILSLNGLTIRDRDDDLWRQLEQASTDFADRFGPNGVSSDSRAAAVRRMFKAAGIDPTRYRPSSEALARRAIQGKGLYQINTAVDVNNWCSLEERLPFGIYDAAHLRGPVLLRLGRENEVYEGIGKSLIALEGKILLADELGAFGSPISDSTRAMVTTETHAIHCVIFAPGVSRDALTAILQKTGERLARYNDGSAVSDFQIQISD
jgi:DNA/RNA-binding domain of Phe-tRNA-synthetase-like protein